MESDWARPVAHWEIMARDPAAQASFYREHFSWDIGEGAFMEVRPGIGGPEPGPGGHIRAGDASGVVLFAKVRELRATLERATKIGARVT